MRTPPCILVAPVTFAILVHVSCGGRVTERQVGSGGSGAEDGGPNAVGGSDALPASDSSVESDASDVFDGGGIDSGVDARPDSPSGDSAVGCKDVPEGSSTEACALCESPEYAGCHCEAETKACLDNPACAGIAACVKDGNGTVGPCELTAASGASCVLDCASFHSSGLAEYRALQSCVGCGQCKLSCEATAFCAAFEVLPSDDPGVAAGGDHSCARKKDGSLWCWGANWHGALGDGTTDHKNVPVNIASLGVGVGMHAVGWAHACAIKSDNTLSCWGNNAIGQLGGSTNMNELLPVQVSAVGTNIRFIAAAEDHTCAAFIDGTVWCWGYNESGQLGDESLANASTPVQVGLSSPVATTVAAARNHSCARRVDGTAWCWGRNWSGELGVGTQTVAEPQPLHVSALGTAVTAIVTGQSHTCARTHGGVVWCWGYAGVGQLGTGQSGGAINVPVQVTGLGTGVLAIATSDSHTCAVKSDRTLWCWGANSHGQIGDGSVLAHPPTPVHVAALGADVIAVAPGSSHTCARKADGSLWCWGRNVQGQLGTGTNDDSPLPVQVVGF